MLPPCTYQGGKQRLAKSICDIIEEDNKDFVFYDLCCGSGAVSLEMISRGHKCVMCDSGVFGEVWRSIGDGTFDIQKLEEEIKKLPDTKNIYSYFKSISRRPVDEETKIYLYILMQAGSFGGKQISVEGNEWITNSFRDYWEPTETSNRRSPVNPMMPMPEEILRRMKEILRYSKFVTGYNCDIYEIIETIKNDRRNKVIYIDPPYTNTTKYHNSFDIYDIVSKLDGNAIYVSEGIKLNVESCESIILSNGRKKGNITGKAKKEPVIEILNIIR